MSKKCDWVCRDSQYVIYVLYVNSYIWRILFQYWFMWLIISDLIPFITLKQHFKSNALIFCLNTPFSALISAFVVICRRKISIFCGQTVAGQRVEIKTSSKMHQRGMFRCHARKIAVKDVVADKKSKLKLNECKLYHVNQIVLFS